MTRTQAAAKLLDTVQGAPELTRKAFSRSWRVDFTVIGDIADVETFAVGKKIREFGRLQKRYGKGRWRKRKGRATVRLSDGTIRDAEVHWYEATGIGRHELKIKRYLN